MKDVWLKPEEYDALVLRFCFMAGTPMQYTVKELLGDFERKKMPADIIKTMRHLIVAAFNAGREYGEPS